LRGVYRNDALTSFAAAIRYVSDWKTALVLAVWLWFGFSALRWIGAIMWEKTPWQVAAIHSGDWLLKTTLIAPILGVWRDKHCEVDEAHRQENYDAATQCFQKTKPQIGVRNGWLR